MWVTYVLTLVVLFCQPMALDGSLVSRLNLFRRPPEVPKKNRFFNTIILDSKYAQMSILCGGSIACLQIFNVWMSRINPKSGLEKILPIVENIREENFKIKKQIQQLEAALQESAKNINIITENKRHLDMGISRDIDLRIVAVEDIVRDLELSYNSSMTKFEDFGERLLDETDRKYNLLQQKIDSEMSELNSALNEFKAQVPKLIRLSDQKMTKIIESYGKKITGRNKKQ